MLSFTLGAALMYTLVRRREETALAESARPEQPAERTWVPKPTTVEPVADDYDTRPIHRNPVVGLSQLEPALASLSEPVSGPVLRSVPRLDLRAVGEVPPEPVPVEPQPAVEPRPAVAAKPAVAAEAEELELLVEFGDAGEPVTAKAPIAAAPIAAAPIAAAPIAAAIPEPAVAPEPTAGPERDPAPVAEDAEPSDEPETVGAARYDQDGDFEPPVGEPEAPEPTVAAGTDTPVLPPPAAPQPVERATWVEREDFRQRYLRTFEEVRRKADSN
ncbi:hypothetical protein V1227_34650 [Lentzea sp. DG1S-22]|uniref:hypothetical protein n=1 Tax=Lentzea sp. DG1S-22 TaxID=3108822 RepID=UPI002E7A011E|nr:hypothetical protein [Lentzea sp. DG1S-22]WVH80106.1 hypothetical protein V1227_34650 [Lentzea sp. DG1S-22]